MKRDGRIATQMKAAGRKREGENATRTRDGVQRPVVGGPVGGGGDGAPLLKKPQSFKKARGTPHPRVLREQLAADIDKPRAYYYWKIVGPKWPGGSRWEIRSRENGFSTVKVVRRGPEAGRFRRKEGRTFSNSPIIP